MVVPPVPARVRVFAPTPVAVTAEESVSAPLPEASSTAPPVVPARSMTRSDVSFDEPVQRTVPVVVRLPRARVPLAVLVTVPRPPAVPTLPSLDTLRVPLFTVVLPEKVLVVAESVTTPAPSTTSPPAPAMAPETRMSPAPPKVSRFALLSRAPERVSVPASELMRASPPSVIAPA